MNMIPMPDMGWVPIVMVYGVYTLYFTVPLTIWVEVLLMQKLLRATFWRSIRNVVAMNIVSALFGIAYLTFMGPSIGSAGAEYGATYYESTPAAVIELFVYVLVIPYLASIVIEGVTLFLIERNSSLRSSFIISLAGNTASYIGIFVVGILFYFSPTM